ncbi:MAG: sulfotransferase [Pseudomonadota bacterium]
MTDASDPHPVADPPGHSGLPDFLLIGAMKAATSTLSAYFEDHPQTFMVAPVEPHFFSHDDNWRKGADWYGTFFQGAAPGQIIGEGSNSYTASPRFPSAAARIHATVPDVKLVYMVRDPVERIISHWIQNRADRGDRVSASLDAAVEADPERFVDQSRYGMQLDPYLALFPRAQIHVGFLEDLQSDPGAFYAGLCTFLGIETVAQPGRSKQNTSQGKAAPTRSYDRIKGVPGLRRMARLVPQDLRRAVKRRLFWKPIEGRPAFSPAFERALRAELAEDTARFLGLCGRPPDFWDRKAH